MSRLKSRQSFPPGGWLFFQPETGWNSNPWLSFDAVTNDLIKHRQANPRHNLSTDRATVEFELERYTVKRLESLPNAQSYLVDGPSIGASPPNPRMAAPARPVAAVAAVKNTAAGIGAVVEWLGDGLAPVDSTISNQRAKVCVECPHNVDGNFFQKIDALAAKQIKTLVEVKNDMKLSTPFDDRLKSCEICDCWQQLKVWAPIKHIGNHTSAEVMAKLPAWCWIPKEING